MALHRTCWLTVSVAVTVLLCAPAEAIGVRLGWIPVAGSAGYRVYRRASTQPYGPGVDVGSLSPDPAGVVRYVIGNVPTDVPSYFAVTSYDANGVESPFSNELPLKFPLECAAAPIGGCRAPMVAAGAVLSMRNAPGVDRDRLTWNWREGAAAGAGDFGDPLLDTNYILCVYDESGGVSSLAMSVHIPAGGLCGDTQPCWRDRGSRGFAYMNRGIGASGLLKVKLKRSPEGPATIQVSGTGQSVTMPDAVAGPFVEQEPEVVVQLVNDAIPPACWDATYSADARVRTATRFKDSSD